MPTSLGRSSPPPSYRPLVTIFAGLLGMIIVAFAALAFDVATLTPEELAPLEDGDLPTTTTTVDTPQAIAKAPAMKKSVNIDTGEMIDCGEIADLEMSTSEIAVPVAEEAQPKLVDELELIVSQSVESARARGLLTEENRLVDGYDEQQYREWQKETFGGLPNMLTCMEDTFELGDGKLDEVQRYCARKSKSTPIARRVSVPPTDTPIADAALVDY